MTDSELRAIIAVKATSEALAAAAEVMARAARKLSKRFDNATVAGGHRALQGEKMAIKVPNVKRSKPRPEDLEPVAAAMQYVELRNEVKALEKRMKALKDVVVSHIEENGVEDDKGNLTVFFEVPHAGASAVRLQRRVSEHLNSDRAVEIIKEHGLENKCIALVPTVDEREIETAMLNDELTNDEVLAMYDSKVTFALTVVAE